MTDRFVIQPASEDDHYQALAEQLTPKLLASLESAGPGHRLRVTTLPVAVMERLATSLDDPRWLVRVLNEHSTKAYEATAATIIRLRDHADVPVLVFFPPGPRTASEDSLDIATFTELSLASQALNLADILLERIQEPLRSEIREVLRHLAEVRQIRHADEQVNYLLTVIKNGGTREAAGGAVFLFGLVPDFALFTRGATATLNWVSRNRQRADKLADVNQPIQKRLQALNLKPNTLQKDLFKFFRLRQTEEPRVWGSAIATAVGARNLAFDRWEFTDSEEDSELRIVLDPLNLPRQLADNVSGADRLPVLNVTGRDPLKLAFRSVPAASQVPSWKNWRVQLLAVGADGATVAWESNSYPKPAAGRLAKIRRSVKTKDLENLDEGTYFLRIDAYDAEGALLTTPRRIEPEDNNSRAENESEPFLIVREEVMIDEPDVRATYAPSLLSVWLRGALKALDGQSREAVPARSALTGSWNQPVGASIKGDLRFDLETDGFHGFAVVVPGLLRKVETTILDSPRKLGVWAMALGRARTPSDIELVLREQCNADDVPCAQAFFAAREAVFRSIRDQHLPPGAMPEERSDRLGIVEVVDLTCIAENILEYARAYAKLVDDAMGLEPLQRTVLLRAIAWSDAIELRWQSQPGDPGRGILLSPTHPLRMLWHLQHANECAKAIAGWDSRTQQVPDWRHFIEQVRDELLPMNLPMALFDRHARAYIEALPITPFWALYLPDRDRQGRHVEATAARDRALEQMAVRARSVAVTTVNPDEIAARLFEFVMQHPYVDQLRLNVFNPGNGQLLADVLRGVESLRRAARSPSTLRYAVRLFAPAGQLDSVGEAVESLLDPERHVGEDDEFTLDSGNNLHPKLLVARNDIAEFLSDHTSFSAHLSIMVEQFTALGRVGLLTQYRRGSFVGGLVQEPETIPLDSPEVDGRQATGWSKGVRPTLRSSGDLIENLIAVALVATHRLQATVALGEPVESQVGPILALQLDAEAKGLLRQVHEISDRVITIDRHLGVDFFDTPSAGEEAGYLLDFAPEFLQEERQRIVLTTRNTKEIEIVLSPMLNAYGINLRPGDEVMVLDSLRSLSGRLALRLESSTTRAKEVVGLLFARWLMEEIGALESRIVLPLDAHRSWFTGPGSQRRADLLLVSFPGGGIVRMDVIEVKLRDDLPVSARSALYESMRDQTDTTRDRLRTMFDTDLYAVPRADLSLRAKELTGVLSFYIRRAVRYGLLGPTDGELALSAAERLDEGYRLEIECMGIVFERLGSGHHLDEHEPGFPVHRFGADKARKLFHAAMGRHDERSSRRSDRGSTVPCVMRDVSQFADEPREESLIEALRTNLSVRSSRIAPIAGDALNETVAPSWRDVGAQADPSDDGSKDLSAETILQSPIVSGSTEQPSVATVSNNGDPSGTSRDGVQQPIANGIPLLCPNTLLGATTISPQYGLLGKSNSSTVAIDLNGCNTISLFGVQGFGKSYTMGVIAEMASVQNSGINVLPSPLATVIFHFHKSDAYEPEFVTAVSANRKTSEIDRLLSEYGASPKGLADVLLLTPEAKVEARRRDYPGLEVMPIKFSSSELGAESWKFLLGAYGNESLYIRQLVAIMRRHRSGLTVEVFRQEIQQAGLPAAALRLALDRLALAEAYVDDQSNLGTLLKPGRTLIVDLRDEWIEKDEALGLFVVMLRIFAASRHEGKEFNKLVVFDEAHKYISESSLISQVVETIREMRHQATSVIIASQDPISVPRAIIELTSILILHRMTSPQWIKHLRGALAALEDVQDAAVTSLQPGEALVWAQRSTDKRFTLRPQKVTIRPRFTQHGGGTKTAVDGATTR